MDDKEIMTAEEVADYLRVSERTIYDWAQKGEIPAGKLVNAWRFKRSDIVRWVNERLASAKNGDRPAWDSLSELLPEKRILMLDCATKSEILNALIDVLVQTSSMPDKNVLTRAIFDREKLMSTGMGLGIAIPHVRLTGVDGVVMAACVSKNPIEDYESLDGHPVQMVFMIVAGSDQHPEYLRALARLTGLVKQEALRRELMNAPDAAAFHQILVKGV